MSTSPEIPKTSQTVGFAHKAAKASCGSFLVILLLQAFASRAVPKSILDLIALVVILVGLGLGFVALLGIRKHGRKGILVPAIVGILINGLLVLIFVTNFLAARGRAQINATRTLKSTPVASADKQGNGRQTYRGEGLVFDCDEAYQLNENKETGQVFLEHKDSVVIVRNFHQLVDRAETLKIQASALQQDFKKHSYSGVTQSEDQTVDGSNRSGGLVRMGYDRPGPTRILADLYVLSDQTNSVSIYHSYPAAKESNAKRLFQPLLQSLKDGR